MLHYKRGYIQYFMCSHCFVSQTLHWQSWCLQLFLLHNIVTWPRLANTCDHEHGVGPDVMALIFHCRVVSRKSRHQLAWIRISLYYTDMWWLGLAPNTATIAAPPISCFETTDMRNSMFISIADLTICFCGHIRLPNWRILLVTILRIN